MHMQLGSIPQPPLAWPPAADDARAPADAVGFSGSRLLALALGWLRDDRVLRKKAEASKGRQRGPRTDVRPPYLAGSASSPIVPADETPFPPGALQTKDAKTFYEKYDYQS